jgi:hypothetical protein
MFGQKHLLKILLDMFKPNDPLPYTGMIDWLIDYILDLGPHSPDAPRPFNRPFVPHIIQRTPEAPLKFQMVTKLMETRSPNKAPDGPNA